MGAVPQYETLLLSSSVPFIPERTGKFWRGKDELLVGENDSSIFYEDFAVAMADKIEQLANVRQRFTVWY
jgi:hypothetical protein